MRLFAISIIILALSWSAEAFAEITATQVKLYWDAPVVGQGQSAPDHFILQRKDAACSSSGNFVDVDKVGAQVFNIVDLNVQQQARYCFECGRHAKRAVQHGGGRNPFGGACAGDEPPADAVVERRAWRWCMFQYLMRELVR